MKHVSDDELVLYCYNESDLGHSIEAHLRACQDCAHKLQRLRAMLSLLRLPAPPERAEDYGRSVWHAIRYRLPERRTRAWFHSPTPRQTRFAFGSIAVVFLALLAGRMFHSAHPAASRERWNDSQTGNSVLLVAAGDHLERSEMLITELVSGHAAGGADISAEQARARDAVLANRLYRQAAERSGKAALVELLTELERTLVEIANCSSVLSEMELQRIRDAIQSQDILLKVRITEESLRRRAIPMANTSARRV